MHQIPFGGRRLPGPAGKLIAIPRWIKESLLLGELVWEGREWREGVKGRVGTGKEPLISWILDTPWTYVVFVR